MITQIQTSIIQARNVKKIYRNGHLRVEALKGIDLSVAPGEIVAIMGQSGCGKTTLLNCLSGLDTIDEGDVFIRGDNLRDLSDNERTAYRARHMGFIFQDFRLLQKKTVFDNVAITLKVVGMPEGLMRPKVMNALRLVGLDQRQGALPSTLSAGEQQRLCLARAIVNDPQVLLADEPTSNLDAQLSAEIFDLLKVVNLRGTTVVVATHSADMVSYLRRRVVTLEDGRVMANGTAEA